jgi:DNA polymerase III alpha subunit (gram-positive type)
MTLVFLDTETTGLDPFVHDVWEVAWSLDASPLIRSEILVHSLKTADPKALELNRYWERFPQGARSRGPQVDLELRKLLEGATIVGANPAFDAAFLHHRWRTQPWNYRLIDISSMAVQAFGLRDDDKSWGLYDVRQLIMKFYAENGIVWDIPEPDHTAGADVATLKACYFALRARVDWHRED